MTGAVAAVIFDPCWVDATTLRLSLMTDCLLTLIGSVLMGSVGTGPALPGRLALTLIGSLIVAQIGCHATFPVIGGAFSLVGQLIIGSFLALIGSSIFKTIGNSALLRIIGSTVIASIGSAFFLIGSSAFVIWVEGLFLIDGMHGSLTSLLQPVVCQDIRQSRHLGRLLAQAGQQVVELALLFVQLLLQRCRIGDALHHRCPLLLRSLAAGGLELGLQLGDSGLQPRRVLLQLRHLLPQQLHRLPRRTIPFTALSRWCGLGAGCIQGDLQVRIVGSQGFHPGLQCLPLRVRVLERRQLILHGVKLRVGVLQLAAQAVTLSLQVSHPARRLLC
mmetsp:Transcript_12802/g.38613  ORF Transcript_12802/g.38613 Transcript_12802/m.38613 type:complete len:332 (-) Transcript_12802:311-1306(-)